MTAFFRWIIDKHLNVHRLLPSAKHAQFEESLEQAKQGASMKPLHRGEGLTG